MKKYVVGDILPFIKEEYTVVGTPAGKHFTSLRPVLEAANDSLVFISSDRKDKQELAEQTKAQIVICDDSIETRKDLCHEKCFIIVSNPKLTYLRVGNSLFTKKQEYSIHPTAYVHPEASIHEKTYIGPFSYIGKCSIDEGTIIYGHCHIYDHTKIGKNVTIHAGCIIGADGFGYIKNEMEEYENFPHIGGTIIEDNAEIGSNTCIDRGALGNTILKEGAKIDNLVHIAHNVIIGKNALIIAHAQIAGSVCIGDNSWVAPCSTINDGLTIGKRAFVGIGSVVIRDVADNEKVFGNPAESIFSPK